MKHEFDTEIVVVGSGATGGWACKTLVEAGIDVILLEAGAQPRAQDCPADWWYEPGSRLESAPSPNGRQFVQQTEPAYRTSNSHLWVDDVENPYLSGDGSPFVWLRSRSAGGRSNLWAGQSWRISEREFAAPDLDGFGMRWPVRYTDLAADYDEVERFHALSGSRDGIAEIPDQIVHSAAVLSDAERGLVQAVQQRWGRKAIAGRVASSERCEFPGAGKWPRSSSLGSTLPAALASGRLKIVYNAVVSHIDTDQAGARVETVGYIDAATGRESRIRAKAVMLCASTVESTRILLNSRSPRRHAEGLGNSSGALGRFLMDHTASFAVGSVPTGGGSDESTFHAGANGLLLPRFERACGRPDFLRSYSVWAALGRPAGNGANALLVAVGEMLPYADNRITLDPAKVDRWGLPVPRIECSLRDNEKRMQAHQKSTLVEVARAAGMTLALPPVGGLPGSMIHEVGTARMGKEAASSFCNAYAQSWDLPNLFVPDGACWTTSAFQNPTLTMMALARRSSSYAARWLRSTAY
ncbi:GMC oxidoreductase [Tahibacter harae]|uniref:GMC family oxidoreductase n=1 Tax=Tahibacter harae TaxID=2963937 RepID=A0ABT1QT38_9GAMM|nr:GMC family oxidoreductase [Tahibacter harae]MCQ4165453.1 GMC family oxidoreductase [Tahibacter harae]